jgi:hypothetical protein|tara:strand:+ start:23 stop:607 length:585 start_codon:yes stop_codon:yes gene_type:complete
MANLITLDDYKTSEKIESTKDDARLNDLIASISALVKTYCGNTIVDHYAANKTETFNITWATNLAQLTESPVNTIVSVEERESFSASYATIPATEYYLDAGTDSIYRVTTSGQSKSWPAGPASVRIIYKAGYATCPADLQLAVIDLINYYHKDEHKARQTMQGASTANNSTSSQNDNVGFPDHIKRVLDMYKNY